MCQRNDFIQKDAMQGVQPKFCAILPWVRQVLIEIESHIGKMIRAVSIAMM